MIVSPSVSEILRGVVHEMSTSLKEGLDNPVKSGQIDTIVGVLSAAAMRCDHQSRIVEEETAAILEVATRCVTENKADAALTQWVSEYDSDAPEAQRYNHASEALSRLADLGTDVGEELYAAIRALMTQRLTNESILIGGGFEAAGRG